MINETIDPAIVQLEDELHESRVSRWEVETFLVERHRAKIDALTQGESKCKARKQAVVEVCDGLCVLIGRATCIALLTYGWLQL